MLTCYTYYNEFILSDIKLNKIKKIYFFNYVYIFVSQGLSDLT